jgi:hypothetical protein
MREGDTRPFQEKTFYLLNPSRLGRYLNYACGDFAAGLDSLLHGGWDVQGFEPFQPQRHPRIHREIAAVEGQAFDGVFTHNYLEHPQSLRAMFGTIHGLLQPGGVMAHSTPCCEYLFEDVPFHLYFLTGGSLPRLCDRTGFRPRDVFRADREHLGWFYEFRSFTRA